MAEGVGFEPTREREPPGGFQDRCLKPLGHPSNSNEIKHLFNFEKNKTGHCHRFCRRGAPVYHECYGFANDAPNRNPQHGVVVAKQVRANLESDGGEAWPIRLKIVTMSMLAAMI